MSDTKHNDQMEAYTEAVKSGLYAKKSGLVGKYDNVRRYWEDETTRQFIGPHLSRLIKRRQKEMRRLRIMDLGCGSADGFELLSGIRQREPDLHQVEVGLLTPDVLGEYRGIDLNADLIYQAREIYGADGKMVFDQASFTDGLPLAKDEKPYDLYFTSFGTCSHHNDDRTFIKLLADIARRTEDYALVVFDWLGRYSYEWQTLWTDDLSKNKNMDYVVSYIYEKEEREARRDELQHLRLRLMSRQEAEDNVAKAAKKANIDIKPLVYFDRSVFTGRHMDTGDYNPYAQPMRHAVNSLHETNMRTDLSDLRLNYVPKKGFPFLNEYCERLQMCWNTLIDYVIHLLENYDEKNECFATEPNDPPPTYPQALREAMRRMRRVVEGCGWLVAGLPRENIIEPQLGYALRHVVTRLQEGIGCGHGLVGIFEIDKS